MGDGALQAQTTGTSNTAVGNQALTFSTRGSDNVAVGAYALANNLEGIFNTAVGTQALVSNLWGHRNTAVGWAALNASTDGIHNTALGNAALHRVTTGSHNIGLGASAGASITTGNHNILIGSIGAAADESHTLRIGDSQTRAFIRGIRGVTAAAGAAIPVLVDTDGQLGTISSSRRFKQDIADLGDVGLKLHQLRPVQFRYTSASTDAPGPLQYGLIAEEVNEVLPELVARSADGAIETVQYHVLPSLLVAEVQRLERERKALADRLEALEALVRSLSKR